MLNNADIIIIKLLNERFPTAAPGPLGRWVIKGYCLIEWCDRCIALLGTEWCKGNTRKTLSRAGVVFAYLCSSALTVLQLWGTSWSNDQVIMKSDDPKAKVKTKLTLESLQGVGANVCLALFQFCWHKVKTYKMSRRMSVLRVTSCRCVTEWCRKPVWFSLLLTLLPHQPQHHAQLSAASPGHWALFRSPCPPGEVF